MNLIFDFDGTLINSKMRLYRLFQKLAPAVKITYEEYWNLKKSKHSNQDILTQHSVIEPVEIDRFHSNWMKLIESEEFLALDEPFPGLDSSLNTLQKHAKLHLCTSRQLREPAIAQLERIKLDHYFDQILITHQTSTKEDLIRKHIPYLSHNDWIIGDTGKDIQTGKVLGIRTCAVLSGFMSSAALIDYKPDIILESAANFTPDHLRILNSNNIA